MWFGLCRDLIVSVSRDIVFQSGSQFDHLFRVLMHLSRISEQCRVLVSNQSVEIVATSYGGSILDVCHFCRDAT